MPPEDKHIKYIRQSFAKLQTKEDLLDLLNYAKDIVYKGKSIPFSLSQLTWFSNPTINKRRYIRFEVSKKRKGEVRVIHAPRKGLKAIQKSLAYILQSVFEPGKAATGFVWNKSVVDNARVHAGNWYVYNLDLRDFFSSVDQARVWKCLQLPPFNMPIQVANIVAALCCTKMQVERMDDKGEWQNEKRNVLPQGAPTSPVLSNVVCQKLDYLLAAVAKKYGAKYSRYADDITFSSLHSIYQPDGDFLKEVARIITQQRFQIKESKTRLQKQGYRQEVTGLVVNEKPNVSKRFIKGLRMWLYYWECYGYAKTLEYFKEYYSADRPQNKIPNMIDVIHGRLDFLSMVRGKADPLYLKLKKRFDTLLPPTAIQNREIEKVGYPEMANIRPRETMEFLKHFKYDDDYPFKHLVHQPIDPEKFDFYELLKDAKKEFIRISRTYDNRLELPKTLYEAVNELFQVLETKGLKYFNDKKLHPIHERETGRIIQKFKRNYRFGNEKSETTSLTTVLVSAAENRRFVAHEEGVTYSFSVVDTSGIFRKEQLVFLPDEKRFKIKANFFTWVPNVIIAFGVMFENILKHSNVNGERPFDPAKKQILIDLNRQKQKDCTSITLSLLDKESLCSANVDSMLRNLRREFLSVLKGVCDFKVQFTDEAGQSYETRVLPYAEATEKIDTNPGGFKYVFTFYD